MRWAQQLGYPYFYFLLCEYFISGWHWTMYKKTSLPDEYTDTMKDLICTYCMGGEL